MSSASKRPVIFDTDWWTDCDDCVALKLLIKSDLKGVNINAFLDESPYSVELFLESYGKRGVPVAIDKNATYYGDKPKNSYQQRIIEKFSHGEQKSSSCYEDSVSFYRRLLSQADEKVDIISVGFQNSIASLLLSGADEFSPLNGIELCKEKVGKLWAMAGKWDEEGGREYNIANNSHSAAAAKIVAEKFPCPITYLGFETGVSVITGGKDVIRNENDALLVAMTAHGSSDGRNSWDPMTAMLCLHGNEEKAGYTTVYGNVYIDENGKNYFEEDNSSDRCYVVKKYSDSYYENEINSLISVDKET